MSSLPFAPWPSHLAESYREKGYWLDLPLTDILERQAKENPLHPAIMCGERNITYQKLHTYVEHLANAFRQHGLRAGMTAIVQLPNVAEFYVVFFALLRVGVAPVNALFSHQRFELSAYAKQLKPSVIIGTSKHICFKDDVFVNALKEKLPQLRHCFVLNDIVGDKPLASNTWYDLGALIHAEPPSSTTSANSDNASPLSITSDPAFFQLSGGSTGIPKLIPRTHNDYYYSVRQSVEVCEFSHRTRYLCCLPAAHNYPLSSPGALGVFYAGGTVVMADSPEPNHCFQRIADHQVTTVALVPSAVALWLHHLAEQPGRQALLGTLSLLQVGGASFPESMARQAVQHFDCQLQQVFGMAEGLVNYTRLNDSDEHTFTTQGRPMSPADEVRVVDLDGNLVAQGETGLLCTRGPYTFRGYWNAPEQNHAVFDAEGFYCSGDLVQQDDHGYLRVVGRHKDQINRGGEKIAAEEIEALLMGHDSVRQAAVIGFSDATLGEKSCACLVVSEPEISAVSIRKYLRLQGIADYKIPDRILFLNALPHTPVGKTDKAALKQQLQTLVV